MPIRIPNDLPAASALRSENIFVMTDTRAKTQDIRPLKILLLNLMPTKIATETQLARLLGNTPIQVELELLMVKSHVAKNTSEEHMLAFYKTFDQVCDKTYDGMVITGAPVERMAFEDVEYWDELCAIFEWTKTHVTSTFHICWGAQAGLYYHWGVPKYMMEKKLSGVYRHRVVHKNSILFRGFDDTFMVPHSRYTTVRREDILAHPEMKILAESDEAGVYAIPPTADGRFSSPVTANTTRTRWRRSTCATKPPVSTPMCPAIIIPMTTIPARQSARGARRQTCCTATG